MDKIDQLEKLLELHSYSELSNSEKEFVCEFVNSEEEYEEIRKTGVAMHNLKNQSHPIPHTTTWKKIVASRKAIRDQNVTRPWFAMPIPAYVSALLLLLVGVSAWIGGRKSVNPTIVEKIATQRDTVFVMLKADTIVREKIVYRTIVERIPAAERSPDRSTDGAVASQKGVSMLEKEELGKLLVSGSR